MLTVCAAWSTVNLSDGKGHHCNISRWLTSAVGKVDFVPRNNVLS